MNEVNIILCDNEDGTLGVRIVAEPVSEYSQAHQVAAMFLEWLKAIQDKPKIVTES